MEAWDKDAIDLMGAGYIELAKHGGSMSFIAVEGTLDCRYAERDGRPCVEFSWTGSDDADAACGRGWARLEADGALVGRIFIHDGDDSSFRAKRLDTPPERASRRRGTH